MIILLLVHCRVYVDVYYNKKFDHKETLIFTDHLVHDKIAFVLPSTRGVNQSHFRWDLKATDRKLDMLKNVLGEFLFAYYAVFVFLFLN